MTSSSKSKICFFYETEVSLKKRTALKHFIENLFRKEKRALLTLNYIFCTDQRLLEINRQYLKHDYYTDIITFELSEPGAPILGEIYISVDRVRDNAEHLEQTFQRELYRVIFHGALHLCGFKDKTKKDQELMRKMEEKYLLKYAK